MTTMMEIINNQILRWEKHRQITTRETRRETHQLPVVTISSAYGSKGQAIGAAVAELLGFDFFDRALIEKIASLADVRERTVESLDECVQSWIEEHISSQFSREVFTSSDYLRQLSRVLLAIGKHGEAVIIGRGSQMILDPEWTIRVRTTASFGARVLTIANEEGLEPIAARERVLRKDSEREAFCRLHFNRDVKDPGLYDLVINTASGPLASHADMIAYAYLQRFGNTR